MKLFDKIGILVVATWLGLAGFYIYQSQSSSGSESSQRSDEFVMREGGTWLVLRRNDQDAGFTRQTRTQLVDGWLLEHDTYMVIEVLGTLQWIDAVVKSRLDTDGFLRQFTTEVSTSGGVFKATGRVEGDTLHLSKTLGDKAKSEKIALDKPVRMSTNALNTLLAAAELVPGESYNERYIDPYLTELVEVEMRYIDHQSLEVYDENFQADHFRQRAGSRELDFYVDEDSDLLIRTFPVRITSARIPAALGKTRAASIRRQLDKRSADAKSDDDDAAEAPTLNINIARQILAGKFSPEVLAISDERPAPDEASEDADSEDADTEDSLDMKIAE